MSFGFGSDAPAPLAPLPPPVPPPPPRFTVPPPLLLPPPLAATVPVPVGCFGSGGVPHPMVTTAATTNVSAWRTALL